MKQQNCIWKNNVKIKTNSCINAKKRNAPRVRSYQIRKKTSVIKIMRLYQGEVRYAKVTILIPVMEKVKGLSIIQYLARLYECTFFNDP